MMKRNQFFIIVIALSMFTACSKTDPSPAVQIPATEVTYSSIDSMKLDSTYFGGLISVSTFNQVNKKQYLVNNTRALAFYVVENNAFKIVIADTNTNGFVNKLTISIGNKTINDVAGTYNFNSAEVCLTWSQVLELNPFFGVVSVLCEQNVTGKILLQVDLANNTINGQIQNLRYSFGHYVPLYQNGSMPEQNLPTYLKQSGSTRNQEITFKNVKKQ